jgi:F-box-like
MWNYLFGNNPPLNGPTNGNTGYTLTTPPVPALLLSNRAPTDVEAELISSSIAAVEFEIRLINHCSPRFNPDDGQIDVYKEFIYLQSALLFRQLPPVILKKIFLYFTGRDGEPSSNKPPWVLGQVCRRWRAIALDTPNLWSNLPPVRLGTSKDPDDVAKIFTCLATLLNRCSGRPISFFLHSKVANSMEYPIIGLLVAHCPQWANVSLELSGITIRRFFSIEGQLVSLHSLEFSLCGRGEPIVTLFESAPRLRTVRVNNLVCPGMLRLPWAQLTSYEDRTAFCDGVFKGFLPNSRLQYLKFSPNRDEKPDFLPHVRWKPVIIPRLTSLSIEFWDREYQIKTLFESLTLPALQTLVLKFSKYDNVTDVDLVKMITRSHCDLEHFTFHGCDSPIQQFLAVMPSLRTLDINDPDPKLITELSHFQNGEWTLMPCLRSLTIHLSKSYKHQYLAMLSRAAGIRCDTVSAFRVGRLLTPVLKTFKVAIHGAENHCLSHFYYASLEPPTTEMEARSADRIAKVYACMMKQIPITLDPSCTLPFELDGRDIINEDQSFRMGSGIWKRRGRIYTDIMTRLTSLIVSDPQAVAGVYVRILLGFFGCHR